ncbi:MAG: Unknown protein [uncultured Aureispira sp.]|uniref:SMP-30/Gluconolactonase/LRE-like region domain-containing protein n=1 Tax=uncultured Aureispira sp. TaxID=1331704 RepID=A0A6S6S5H2_9BACT|nr:MAG: Unknown protein [uncultured Aureispira sp.]
MKHLFILLIIISIIGTSCKEEVVIPEIDFPDTITVENIAQNPEGIEYNKNDNTFLLSSINASPVLKVNLDGTHTPFTSGDAFPLSTAGLQIDYDRNRLLVAGFNGLELQDGDPSTKGAAFLRIYNLETGVIEHDINLSALAPNASSYFANDIAVDNDGNVYVSDWYAKVVYKVDLAGTASLFWGNTTAIPGGPNGLDFQPDGYLLVSVLNVNNLGLYSDFGLIKIPVNEPDSAKIVTISDSKFTGFDGMVLKDDGNVVGVTNNGTSPGGNMLIELSGNNNWESADVVNSKAITSSTTVAVTEENGQYIINQDFSNSAKETWTIERIEF